MQSGLILGVWGAATLLALVTAIVSLVIQLRGESIHTLTTQVRQLALDVEDVYDRLEKWTHRSQVRAMREGKQQATAMSVPQPGTPEYKAWLRRRARGELTGQR